jgi:CheY-like chemotaxis protein
MERILIIEDETPMRTVADVLDGEGYRALTAADGESACAASRTKSPTCLARHHDAEARSATRLRGTAAVGESVPC